VAVDRARDGAAAGALLAARAGGDGAVAVLDTPAVSPRDPAAVAALAADHEAAGVTEAHVVLPATIALPVAREALAALAPLRPAGIVVTHADETDHLGPLVDLAIATGVPLSFLVSGADAAGGITLADPAVLATRLLP
jgi:flagellar biosynthesis GTPase FlhF